MTFFVTSSCATHPPCSAAQAISTRTKCATSCMSTLLACPCMGVHVIMTRADVDKSGMCKVATVDTPGWTCVPSHQHADVFAAVSAGTRPRHDLNIGVARAPNPCEARCPGDVSLLVIGSARRISKCASRATGVIGPLNITDIVRCAPPGAKLSLM